METTVERTAPASRGMWASAAAAAFVPFSLDSVVLAAMFVVILAALVTYLIYRGSADGAEGGPSTQETPVRDRFMDKEPSVEPAAAPKSAPRIANASGRMALIIAIVALAVGAAGFAVGLMSAQPPAAAAAYTPTTVHLQIAIVPDLQGGGWDVWLPNQLVVHDGDTVVLTILNSDTMAHGFYLPQFNVNQPIPAGTADNVTGDVTPSITTVTFTANSVGNFEFSCNVYCGAGHDNMIGYLTVLADD